MGDLRAASAARPEPAPADPTDGIPATFRTPDGAAARIDDSAAKAALELLAGRWPASVGFGALLRDARRRAGRTGRPTPMERREFAAFLASGHALGLVELHTWEPPMTTAVGDRPVASALARIEIEHDPRVTSLRHRPVDVDDPVAATMLARLDGSRDFETLRKDLRRAFPGVAHPGSYLRMVLSGFGAPLPAGRVSGACWKFELAGRRYERRLAAAPQPPRQQQEDESGQRTVREQAVERHELPGGISG